LDRDEALALLQDQHEFPGPFGFRVIVDMHRRAEVVAAVQACLGDEEHLVEVRERASRKGAFVSLHLQAHVSTPSTVLEVYAVCRAIDGVRMTM